MKVGEIVVRKSHDKDLTFQIVEIKEVDGKTVCVLSGVNMRILADAPEEDLEVVREEDCGRIDNIFNCKVKKNINKILLSRGNDSSARSIMEEDIRVKKNLKSKEKKFKEQELIFARPGKILHVDGDARYLDECLKVYKQLGLIAEGHVVAESSQPNVIVDLVKNFKADIVVITGHDGMLKGTQDYLKLDNYRNSKYFVEAVSKLRDYEPNYDNLVIYAGACQSCYEAILDAGANFASSPNRVLIHCLDPVFICEKVAYTAIDKIVNIRDVIENTITGVNGIGGLQTRGKYREGYPKSCFI
ncbi:MAG: sporulation peptidase YabG [Clostridiaceae bacterium]